MDIVIIDCITKTAGTIIDAIVPLLNGEQELAFCVIEGEEKLCTAMPMEHGRTLVKIARSKPSALAKRYYNLVTAIDKIPDAAIICSDGKIDLVNEQFQNIFPFCGNKSLVTISHKGIAIYRLLPIAFYDGNLIVSKRCLCRSQRPTDNSMSIAIISLSQVDVLASLSMSHK